MNPHRPELSFDGKGINGPDEYRTRIATFTSEENARKYGHLFAAAPALKRTAELAHAFLESLPEGWLGNTRGDIGTLNEFYVEYRMLPPLDSTPDAPSVRDNLDAFSRAYIECALWSSTDNNNEPLDSKYDIEDIDSDSLDLIVTECHLFQLYYDHLIAGEESQDWSQAGHDFWLTRNGHGAGFWDGDWPKYGDYLTKASKKFGECYIMVGHGNKLYFEA